MSISMMVCRTSPPPKCRPGAAGQAVHPGRQGGQVLAVLPAHVLRGGHDQAVAGQHQRLAGRARTRATRLSSSQLSCPPVSPCAIALLPVGIVQGRGPGPAPAALQSRIVHVFHALLPACCSEAGAAGSGRPARQAGARPPGLAVGPRRRLAAQLRGQVVPARTRRGRPRWVRSAADRPVTPRAGLGSLPARWRPPRASTLGARLGGHAGGQRPGFLRGRSGRPARGGSRRRPARASQTGPSQSG